MGVAVMTSTLVPPFDPLAWSARRWCTPKRCCSSMTAKARSLKTTSPWNNACVPISMSISPDASRSSRASRDLPFSRPVNSPIVNPAFSASGAIVSACWRASTSVGAISAACAPASTATAMAKSATIVLPEPTSPCKRRNMRWVAARSSEISFKAVRCDPVSLKGRAAAIFRRMPPSPVIARPLCAFMF